MPKIIKPKDKNHWLQLKTEDISSTESSALFGLSPYSTEFELYHQKKSGEIIEFDDNERMYCGRMMEDTIAQMVAEMYGVKVRRLKTYMRHSTCKGMGSSFDYEIVGKLAGTKLKKMFPFLKGTGLLEIKNVDSLIYRNEWDTDEAPPHIESQVQHQLETINRDWVIIAALVGGNSLNIIVRARNKKVGRAIVKRIKQFWKDLAVRNEPEPDFCRDAEFIINMYNHDDDDPIDISDDELLKSMVMTFQELRDRQNALDKATNAIKAELFLTVEGAPKLFTTDGLTVNLTRTKDTPPVFITKDMVGETYGGREGYRQLRVNDKRK